MRFWILFSLIFLHLSVNGQTVIWNEEFTYPDGSLQGPGTPPKWTLDIQNCSLEGEDHFEIRSERIEGNDLDGEAVWISEPISIAGYTDCSVRIELSETGALESSDYIGCSYILDSGEENPFPVNGMVYDDFDALTASVSNLSGNTLIIMVWMQNNANSENHRFDNIKVEGFAANHPPVIQGSTVQSITDKQTVVPFGTVTVLDADNDNLTLTIDIKNSAAGYFTPTSIIASGFTGPVNDRITLAPAHPAQAQAAIRQLVFEPVENRLPPDRSECVEYIIRASDGMSGISDSSTVIKITSLNDPVQLGKIEPQTAIEDGETEKYPLVISDPDPGSVLVSAWSWDTALLPNSGIILRGSGKDRELKLILAPDQYGSTKVSVRVTDGYSEDVKTCTVNVIAVNDSPVFIQDLPEITLCPGEPCRIPVSSWYDYVEDADNPDSTLTWTIQDNLHTIASLEGDTIVFSSRDNWIGKDSMVVSVSDLSLSSQTVLYITITDSSLDAGNTATGVQNNPEKPGFFLSPNFPNPFNAVTTFHFGVPFTSRIRLNIYDVTGRQVADLIDEIRQPGIYSVCWEAANVSAGYYFYRLSMENMSKSGKCLLLK